MMCCLGVTFAKSRMRESRPYGSVRAKPNGLATRPHPRGGASQGMGRPPLPFRLRASDRERVESMLKKGLQQVRVTTRVMALLQLDQGLSAPQVARLVRLTPAGVHKIAARYRHGGVDAALFERPRPGAAQVLSPSEKQQIIAMVCSTPPDGAARWTVRLITDEVLKRKLVPQVGRETSGGRMTR